MWPHSYDIKTSAPFSVKTLFFYSIKFCNIRGKTPKQTLKNKQIWMTCSCINDKSTSSTCILDLFPLDLNLNFSGNASIHVLSCSSSTLLTLPSGCSGSRHIVFGCARNLQVRPVNGSTHGADPAGAAGMTFTSRQQPTFTIQMTAAQHAP